MDDSLNKRYNKLTIIEDTGNRTKSGHIVFLCVCDCGNTKEVSSCNLRSGGVKSCGCLMKKGNSLTHGDSKSYTYTTWNSMRTRCLNPNASNYHRYGGRGITICSRWNSYEKFVQDMGKRPEGLTIDRIDPNGNYEPSNCRWATAMVQRHNRVT